MPEEQPPKPIMNTNEFRDIFSRTCKTVLEQYKARSGTPQLPEGTIEAAFDALQDKLREEGFKGHTVEEYQTIFDRADDTGPLAFFKKDEVITKYIIDLLTEAETLLSDDKVPMVIKDPTEYVFWIMEKAIEKGAKDGLALNDPKTIEAVKEISNILNSLKEEKANTPSIRR